MKDSDGQRIIRVNNFARVDSKSYRYATNTPLDILTLYSYLCVAPTSTSRSSARERHHHRDVSLSWNRHDTVVMTSLIEAERSAIDIQSIGSSETFYVVGSLKFCALEETSASLILRVNDRSFVTTTVVSVKITLRLLRTEDLIERNTFVIPSKYYQTCFTDIRDMFHPSS